MNSRTASGIINGYLTTAFAGACGRYTKSYFIKSHQKINRFYLHRFSAAFTIKTMTQCTFCIGTQLNKSMALMVFMLSNFHISKILIFLFEKKELGLFHTESRNNENLKPDSQIL